MAWVTPPTFVSGNALTAAQLNILGGDINESAAAKASAAGQMFVATGANALIARTLGFNLYTGGGGTDYTNSTTYIGLSGGAAVTSTTGTSCLVHHGSTLGTDTAGSRAWTSFAISGATTLASSDDWGVALDTSAANRIGKMGVTFVHTGLTAGSNTFTQQMRVTGGIGGFGIRHIGTIPL